MPSVSINDTIIKYNVIRSDRKTISIIVDPDQGVIIRSPDQLTQNKIEKIVKEKSSWILKKIAKVREIKPAPEPFEFVNGERLLYLGKRYEIKVKNYERKKVRVKFHQGKFLINVPYVLEKDKAKRRKKIRDKVIQWYRKHADAKIKERVNKYKVKIGVEPNNIRIKKQKKRWGSCSSKGNLNFNWKIIMAPVPIVDYIVIHELTHLKQGNHSRDFWELISTIIPDYKSKEEWLRINRRVLDI